MIAARLFLVVGLVSAGMAGAMAQPATTRPEINAAVPGTPDEIIAWRQANYKWQGDTFGDMKKAIDAGADVTPFAAKAADMAAWGRRVPSAFPAGTETGGPAGHPTKALPTVWSNRAVFEQNATNMTTESAKLSTIAASGDKAAFAAQWRATGATCGACHGPGGFRARQ